jgi:hypothetical protein
MLNVALVLSIIFGIITVFVFGSIIFAIIKKYDQGEIVIGVTMFCLFAFFSCIFYYQHLYDIKIYTKKILLIKKVSKILSIPANIKQKNDKIYLLSLASKKSYKYDNIILKCGIKYRYNKDTVDFKAIKSCVEGKTVKKNISLF